MFEAVKKDLHEQYFGDEKRPKNPFKNCKSALEVFHLSRRIQAEIGMTLRRIGIICSEEGEIRLKGDTKKIFQVEKFITPAGSQLPAQKQDATGVEKYYKRDYFLPLYDMLTALSTQNLQHEGIQLEALNGQRLYCRKGVISTQQVWPPTHERLYNFFKSYLEDKAHFFKELEGILEIGCGTGALSMILSKYTKKKETIHTLDVNPEAVKTVDMNKNILGIQDRITSVQADIKTLASMSDSQLSTFFENHK